MQLAVVLCAVLIIQYLLSFLQIKHYKRNINKIISDYKGENGYFMFSGMERGTFRPGAIAILVVDQDYIVHECHMLRGVSIMTKFKPLEKYIGQHVGEIVSDINDSTPVKGKKKRPAYRSALLQAGENALLTISKNKLSVQL